MDNNYNVYNENTSAVLEKNDVYNEIVNTSTEKNVHVPSLVLMIIGAVFALLFTYVTYVCSTISLIMSIVKRRKYKTTYAIVINIIALVVAVINSILGLMMAGIITF